MTNNVQDTSTDMTNNVQDTSIDITAIIPMAEAMFTDWNEKALNPAGEDAAYGLEPDVRPCWHALKPVEAMLDGVRKAIDGSTYNGNKRRGLNDYIEMSLNQARRLNDSNRLLDPEMTDKAGAARFTPEGEKLNRRINDQKHLLDMLNGIADTLEAAYAIASGGEEYKSPTERQALYAAREQQQSKGDNQLKAFFGL